MNTHGLRWILRRRNLIPFPFFLLAVVVVCGLTAGVVRSSATVSGGSGHGAQKPPFMSGEDLAKEFNDDDLKVKDDKARGKWGYTTLLDVNQSDDPSVPAYVKGIQLLSGGGKYSGITKIKRVQLKNRSQRTVSSVQLRWEVVNADNPEKILLESTFPFISVSIAPDASPVVELQTLYPAKMLKPLAKDGELNGRFRLTIGVQEARFADGSFWLRPEPVASLKSPYHEQFPGYRFLPIASLAANVFPPLRGPGINRTNMMPCQMKPRLTASAFIFVPVQTTTCYDNSAPFVDEEGRKNCASPAPNLTCHADCSATGHCETWESNDPCGSPTPTPDQSSDCPQPPPHPCCEEELVTTPGTQIQFCRWNCRPPKCGTGTPFADPISEG